MRSTRNRSTRQMSALHSHTQDLTQYGLAVAELFTSLDRSCRISVAHFHQVITHTAVFLKANFSKTYAINRINIIKW